MQAIRAKMHCCGFLSMMSVTNITTVTVKRTEDLQKLPIYTYTNSNAAYNVRICCYNRLELKFSDEIRLTT